MGVAGPLRYTDGNGAKQAVYVPLATTEGALVASISRGMKAIAQAGGSQVVAFRMGTSRGLTFRLKNIQEGLRLSEYFSAQKEKLNTIAQETSGHVTLTDVVVKCVGRYGFVRLSFDTQDAMGMNMATIAADKIAGVVAKEAGVSVLSIAGNYDVDKKPAWLNVIRGRGWEVRADIMLSATVLSETLKTTAGAMYDVWLSKCMIGSALSGSMGYNAHFANVVAALFLATGQDPAHVVEGSVGITTAEEVNEGLCMSVYLPDLMVGTVGGGTGLATQKEALSLLGVAGGNNGKNAQRLAEIVAASVLAGEISLLASLSCGTLAGAHQALARGGK